LNQRIEKQRNGKNHRNEEKHMTGGRDETTGIQSKGMIVWMCVGIHVIHYYRKNAFIH
jgi:hypothetical protein